MQEPQQTKQIKKVIGVNIKALRDEKQLSRRKFAEQLGVDQMLVYKWERGDHRPSDLNLAVLARHGKRSPAWFYTDHSDEVAA